MRALLAIALREVEERRLVFVAALAAGLLPLGAPFIPGIHGYTTQDVRGLAAILVAGSLMIVLAVAFGVTAFPLSASDRRMGFYLARPVPTWALWFGKTIANVGVVAVCGAIVAVPTWVAVWLGGGSLIDEMAKMATLCPLLFAVPAGHLATLVFRSRSALVLVDVTIAMAITYVWALILYHSEFSNSYGLHAPVACVAAAGLLIGLLPSSLAAVIQGRLDIRIARRWASFVLWAVLGASILGLLGTWRWAVSAGPDDLSRGLLVFPSPRGSWVAVNGIARGTRTCFLFDTDSGRYLRTGSAHSALPVFTADGSRAAWFEPRDGGHRLLSAELGEGEIRATQTALFLGDRPSISRLSPAGTRILMFALADDTFEVYDIATGRPLRKDDETFPRSHSVPIFLGEDRIRFHTYVKDGPRRDGGLRLEIVEFDARTGMVEPTGSLENLGCRYSCRTATDPATDTMLLVERQSGRVSLRNGHNASEAAGLADLPPGSLWGSGFLADGRFVLGSSADEQSWVHVFRNDGTHEGTVELPRAGGHRVLFGSEIAPGRLFAYTWPEDRSDHRVWVFDTNTGDVREVAQRLVPVVHLHSDSRWLRPPRPEIGSPASRLFWDVDRTQLIRLDPETGEQEVLLGVGR